MFCVVLGASILSHLSGLLIEKLNKANISGKVFGFPGAKYLDTRILSGLNNLAKSEYINSYPTLTFFILLSGNFIHPCRRYKDARGKIHVHPSSEPIPSPDMHFDVFSNLCNEIKKMFAHKKVSFVFISSPPRIERFPCCNAGVKFENIFADIQTHETFINNKLKHSGVKDIKLYKQHEVLYLLYINKKEIVNSRMNFGNEMRNAEVRNTLRGYNYLSIFWFDENNPPLYQRDNIHLNRRGLELVSEMYMNIIEREKSKVSLIE